MISSSPNKGYARHNTNNNNNNNNNVSLSNMSVRGMKPINYYYTVIIRYITLITIIEVIGIVVTHFLITHYTVLNTIKDTNDISYQSVTLDTYILQDSNSINNNNSNSTMTLQEAIIVQCNKEYLYRKQNQTIGIQSNDYKRSNAYYGNRKRLQQFVTKLVTQQIPVNVVTCGGSISIGHGIKPKEARYANRFINFLNDNFPIIVSDANGQQQQQQQQQHELHMKVAHGADICSMAKRIDRIDIPDNVDLIILEFAVNDYQGQDHVEWLHHQTDIFFDGYQRLSLCAEAVIYKLITKYPNTAIVFFEFKTAVLNRKTAQLLHTGVAQHYQIPIISYGDTVFPNYFNLVHQLNSSSYYSVPIGESIQQYPFGCIPECDTSKMDEDVVCYSVCNYMWDTGYRNNILCSKNALNEYNNEHPDQPKHVPCYLSYLMHDSIHPSYIGHQIARDLLIEMIAVTERELCEQRYRITTSTTTTTGTDSNEITTTNNGAVVSQTNDDNDDNTNNNMALHIPKQYGFLASADHLSTYTDFLLVYDTMYTFGKLDELIPTKHSNGFTLYGDGMAERTGYICTNSTGNEYIEFNINLPIVTFTTNTNNNNDNGCYVVYIAALKSYENMGKFTITLIDHVTNTTMTRTIDGIWEPRISIPIDIQINNDKDTTQLCTGHCTVRITTHNQLPNRTGNKVKIMSLSVRKCLSNQQNTKTVNVLSKLRSKSHQNKINHLLDDPSSWIVV